MTAGDSAPVEHRVTVERSARVYTLGNAKAAAAWVVLHGYGQLAARFIGNFADIAGPDRVIVAPEALNRFYIDIPRPGVAATDRRVGTTWMTREDREAEIADYVAYLDRMLRNVAPEARTVTVLGFSQGVATALRWVALGSTPVRRLILWAGPSPPDLDMQRLAERLTGVRVHVVMGERDPIGVGGELEKQLDALEQAGIQSEITQFEGGHTLDAGVIAQLASA
ncbi:MAG: alpha/beta hydrolase [Gemmatimonadaceae bacterium]